MGKRGPLAPGQKRTASSSAIISVEYFPPEKDMGAAAKKIWRNVVESMTAGYFREVDRPQLRGYCEASVTLARAAKEMNAKDFKEVYEDGKGIKRKNPWIEVYKDSLALVNSTSTKLRISKSTQISPHAAGRVADDAGKAASLEKENQWAGLMFGEERAN